MTDAIFYPDVKIVPVSEIKLQEYVQKNRMKKLADEIQREGILRNPPIVTNFFNGTYLHLDGANRITAIELLRYPMCLVQVVDYSDPTHVRLMSWSHLVSVDTDKFLANVKKIPHMDVRELASYSNKCVIRPRVVCVFMLRNGKTYECSAHVSHTEVVTLMGKCVDLYAQSDVERVFSASPWTSASIKTRFDRYSDKNMFVAFPNFSPSQVITLVDRGVLMPAGITRHVVYRRKLNVNMPLEFLKIKPIEKANEALQKFLQHRHVRLYEEPVIYFE